MKEKIGRNKPCPCGSGKKKKRCCENKVGIFFNKKYNRFESSTDHHYVPFSYGSNNSSNRMIHKAKVKCFLVHMDDGSIIYPEIIFLEKDWIQPLQFTIPILSKFYSDHILCIITIDIPGGESLRMKIENSGFIRSFSDNSQLFDCEIEGPSDLNEYCSGEYLTQQNDYYLNLFHHTDDKGYEGITSSKYVKASKWNYQGTMQCSNYSFAYFSHIPEIKYNSDLITIAMSINEKLHYRIDSFPPPQILPPNFEKIYSNEIYVPKVYRSSTAERNKTISFWINIEMIDLKHLYKHCNGLFYYEVCFPYIHRIKTPPDSNIPFDDDNYINESRISIKKDYAIIGDARTVEGLAAPFKEEETKQVYKIEDCGTKTILEFWFDNPNEDHFSKKKIQPITLR